MDFSWLTARPIAHRGLHDAGRGIVENTLPAALAAVEKGFSIECDVLLSRDEEVVVFHDDTLERLTHATGWVAKHDFAALAAFEMRGTDARIPSLGQLLEAIDGRVGLVIELKSTFPHRRDVRLVERVARLLADYRGPVVTKSFDPDLVEAAHEAMPEIAHGIVAEHARDPKWYGGMGLIGRFGLTHLLHAPRSKPDFVSYCVDDLPSLATMAARGLFHRPLITWTVRTPAQRAVAARFADQIVFEGFDPDAAAEV